MFQEEQLIFALRKAIEQEMDKLPDVDAGTAGGAFPVGKTGKLGDLANAEPVTRPPATNRANL